MNELNPLIDKSAPIADALEIEQMLKVMCKICTIEKFLNMTYYLTL